MQTWKKTVCFFLVVVMAFCLLPVQAGDSVAGNGDDGGFDLRITADCTEARPGDEITFRLILSPVQSLGTMQMRLVIPDGLEYVSGSGALTDGLKNKMGFDSVDFTEETLIVNGFASKADYQSDTDTELLTFRCKVVGGCSGQATVGLDYLEFASCRTWADLTGLCSVESTPVLLKSAAQSAVSVRADRSEACVGDTVSFEVVLSPVQHLGSMQLVLDIPDQLTLVPGSGHITNGLKAAMGYDEIAFTETSLMLNGYASARDYSSAAETVLMSFACKVNVDVTADVNVSVSLKNLEFYSVEDWTDKTAGFEVDAASVLLHAYVHEHTYTGTVTTPATCTAEGVMTFTCSCGDSYTQPIAKVEHTWDNGVITVQPTPTSEGVKTFTCAVCGVTKTETVGKLEEIPEGAATITVDTPTAGKGKTVTVNIGLANNPGIIAMSVNVLYDNHVLELIDVVGMDYNGISFGPLTGNPFTIIWEDSLNPNNESDGILAQLKFKVKEDAEEGLSQIVVEYDPENVFNAAFDNVAFYTEAGGVTVKQYLPGDVDRNGTVNLKDYAQFKQYLNGWDVDIELSVADVTGDGAVNMKDLALLRQAINGWDVVLK